MAKRPRQFPVDPTRTLIFSSVSLDVYEDRDYPGAEPYLTVTLKAVPDKCRCRVPITEPVLRASLDAEEGTALAFGIIEWQKHRAEQIGVRRRMRAKVDGERNRLRDLDEFSARLQREEP